MERIVIDIPDIKSNFDGYNYLCSLYHRLKNCKDKYITFNFSKANLGEKVTVDYTLRKNVSKPNGAKPGFVIYVNQKSIVVEKVELEKI